MVFYVYQFGPIVLALIFAVIVSFFRRRSAVALPRSVRLSNAAAMVVALGGEIAFIVWSLNPTWPASNPTDAFVTYGLIRYIVPLIACVLALLILIVPVRTAEPTGSAELAPRTLVSFASKAGLVWLTTAIAAIVLVAVLAGLASSRDEEGRYVLYSLEASGTSSAATTIYGWWFSLPSFALVAIIIVIVPIALALVSRPPLAVDRLTDIATRQARVRNIVTVSTGGLLIHLGVVFESLYGSSSLRLGLNAGASGLIEFGTPFAAIGPALLVASYVLVILGLAMWWSVLIAAFRSHERQPAEPATA